MWTGTSRRKAATRAIPLCARHHRMGNDPYRKRGPRKFSGVHRLNVPAIVDWLSAKPLIRVESGSFIGRLGNEDYALGTTEAGIARAIRRMSELRREIVAAVA
jgi:hypothetical protein